MPMKLQTVATRSKRLGNVEITMRGVVATDGHVIVVRSDELNHHPDVKLTSGLVARTFPQSLPQALHCAMTIAAGANPKWGTVFRPELFQHHHHVGSAIADYELRQRGRDAIKAMLLNAEERVANLATAHRAIQRKYGPEARQSLRARQRDARTVNHPLAHAVSIGAARVDYRLIERVERIIGKRTAMYAGDPLDPVVIVADGAIALVMPLRT